MNGTTLKFAPNFSCHLRSWAALHLSWVVAAGVAWMLTSVLIARVEAFTVYEISPVIKNPINPPEEASNIAIGVGLDLKHSVQEDEQLAEQLGFIDPSKEPPIKSHQLLVADQTKNAIAVFYVNLKALQDFQMPRTSPAFLSREDFSIALLTEEPNWSNLTGSLSPKRFLYPLTNAKGQVGSSVLVGLRLNSSEWDVIKIGSPGLTQALTNPKLRTPGVNYFSINIRSLNRWYLGWVSDGEFWLKAIVNDRGIDFPKGESRRASEVFLALKKEADKINRSDPLPR